MSNESIAKKSTKKVEKISDKEIEELANEFEDSNKEEIVELSKEELLANNEKFNKLIVNAENIVYEYFSFKDKKELIFSFESKDDFETPYGVSEGYMGKGLTREGKSLNVLIFPNKMLRQIFSKLNRNDILYIKKIGEKKSQNGMYSVFDVRMINQAIPEKDKQSIKLIKEEKVEDKEAK